MIVINMDMPQNCTECPLFDFETGWCSISAGDCPIKCDIEDIKAEIDSYCSDNRDRNDGLYIAMRIIDKHTK